MFSVYKKVIFTKMGISPNCNSSQLEGKIFMDILWFFEKEDFPAVE